jgi:hypothetical protein
LPANIDGIHRSRFETRYKLFDVRNGKLFLTPLNLECVPASDDYTPYLKPLYDYFKIGVGMGMKSFYENPFGVKSKSIWSKLLINFWSKPQIHLE